MRRLKIAENIAMGSLRRISLSGCMFPTRTTFFQCIGCAGFERRQGGPTAQDANNPLEWLTNVHEYKSGFAVTASKT